MKKCTRKQLILFTLSHYITMFSKVMLADHNSNDPHFDVELHIRFVRYVSAIKMHSQQHLDVIALSTETV